ncbi:GNAT family N-acetyltransferase [Altererythrobacter indicus]|uniref:GNAT family N-acetyltransferase n=1 Tax=Altericroceibacterium indicum TaxID=374177 RepID=A0A845A9S2_9SPHN|nr:GNAT family protein [Altericroceibacterium indicum]MXP25545.1 GNAT family N-acetyltransferase [Altericroceibacterium indicum]
MDDLNCLLEAAPVQLKPMVDAHIEHIRTVCAQDEEIWQIYPTNMMGSDFDRNIAAIRQAQDWVNFAVLDSGTGDVVGMTNFIRPDRANRSLEIGGTFIAPKVRATGFNAVMKRLMINHAFACGFNRIEFRVDTRNVRSMAAVQKAGAQAEGVLRQNRITWTGYLRDTAIFAILKEEWQG